MERLQMRPAILEPDEETVRGLGDVPAPVKGPISLGGPDWQPLTEESLAYEPEALSFVRGQPDSRFYRVELAITFAPQEGEPIERFWVRTALAATGATSGRPPIAWSMKPDKVEDLTTTQKKLSFGPQLEILNLGFELGTSRVRKEIALEARYLRQSSPQWVMWRTGSSSITGSQLFLLVVRSPRDAATEGRIEMGAVIYRKKFGLFRHKVRLPDPEAELFTLPAG